MIAGICYTIRMKGTNLVKVGITTNVENRMKALEVGTKCELVYVYVGEDFKEMEIGNHEAWDSMRLPGSEWFLFEGFKSEPPRLCVGIEGPLCGAWGKVVRDSVAALESEGYEPYEIHEDLWLARMASEEAMCG